MLPDDLNHFHVVYDASDFAIGYALMQNNDEGHEGVVGYRSLQIKPAVRTYPVHDNEPLAIRYDPISFRAYQLGEQPFVVYMDHALLRTAMKSPRSIQRIARWLSFFAEYNFVRYNTGKNNILADALFRHLDYDSHGVLGRQVIDDQGEGDDQCPVCVASGVNQTSVSLDINLRDENNNSELTFNTWTSVYLRTGHFPNRYM
ncbi:unnamed protein product [Phytophthora fragariaefolia]|uniref:Unnamed protein product n=1 Tax=Phytophthora fragariaefolia TaxID=1490495 RepID=A0A9W6TXP6_9STRA|nr:unnamed protein product [Phytophthora fragariaefolia]